MLVRRIYWVCNTQDLGCELPCPALSHDRPFAISRARSAGAKRSKTVSFEGPASSSLPLARGGRRGVRGGLNPPTLPDRSLMASIFSQLPQLDEYMLRQACPG